MANSAQVEDMTLGRGFNPSRWPRGWQPYTALLSGFCGQVNCWGLINSFGTFFRYYDESYLPNSTGTTISLIGGMQTFLVLALSVIVGRLLDAQLHRAVVCTGGALTTLGFLALSFTGRQGHEGEGIYGLVLLTHGLVAGIGMSFFFTHSSHCVIQWFPAHKYFAVGITSCGAAVGGLAYPPAFRFLISEHGFPNGIRLFAAIVGAVSAVCILFGASDPAAANRPLGPVFTIRTWIDTEAFRNPLFVMYTAAVCLMFTGYYPLLFYITEWAEQVGPLNIKVVWFLTIMNGCSIVGRLGSAWIASSRKYNPLLVHAASCFAAALFIFLSWPLVQQESHVVAFCVLVGILGGALFGLPASSMAFLLPPDFNDRLGLWTGMMLGLSSISVIGPPISGALVRRYGMISVGLWAGASLIVAGGLVAVAMRKRFTEEKKSAGNSPQLEGDIEGSIHEFHTARSGSWGA